MCKQSICRGAVVVAAALVSALNAINQVNGLQTVLLLECQDDTVSLRNSSLGDFRILCLFCLAISLSVQAGL